MSKPRSTKSHACWRAAIAALLVGLAVLLPSPRASAAPDHVWDTLAQCESTSNWSINTGNGYHGGLQFAPSTWSSFKPDGYPAFAYQASRYQQIVVAEFVLAAQGWTAWPSCSAKWGLRGYAAEPGARDPWAESSPPMVAPPAEPAPPPPPCPLPPGVIPDSVMAHLCF